MFRTCFQRCQETLCILQSIQILVRKLMFSNGCSAWRGHHQPIQICVVCKGLVIGVRPQHYISRGTSGQTQKHMPYMFLCILLLNPDGITVASSALQSTHIHKNITLANYLYLMSPGLHNRCEGESGVYPGTYLHLAVMIESSC